MTRAYCEPVRTFSTHSISECVLHTPMDTPKYPLVNHRLGLTTLLLPRTINYRIAKEHDTVHLIKRIRSDVGEYMRLCVGHPERNKLHGGTMV